MSINRSPNRLLHPSSEVGCSADGYFIFYEENQAAVYWGIQLEDLHKDNPPVYSNYGTKRSPDWQLETKTTSNFLLLMAIYNGVFGGLQFYENCFDIISPSIIHSIEQQWNKIEEISWDKQSVFTTNNFDVVMCLSYNNNNQCEALFIGTSYQENFEELLNKIPVNWSYRSDEHITSSTH